MKIRTRITLFVVGAGVAAGLLLSAWLIFELLEQPFRVLDISLYEESERAVKILCDGQKEGQGTGENVYTLPSIWMEIYDEEADETIYRSPLADMVDLDIVGNTENGTIGMILNSAFRNLHYGPSERKIFRAKYFRIEYGGKTFNVRAARSMEKLDEEIREIFWVVVSSLLLSVMVLFMMGRVVAEKILRPIDNIRSLAQSISDKNLVGRVPVGIEQDELGDLSETLNRMLDRLQLSFAKQRELLFDTSHELKTPLTTMRLAVEEIFRTGQHRLPDEISENVLRLESQVLRMERLVKSLLNLSSLEALRGIDTKPIDVGELMLALADDYRFLAEAENIQLIARIQSGMFVLGDREKLRRAFSNVMDNALKYNAGDGDGIVEVDVSEAGEKIFVLVGNTGEPVPEDQRERIFEQFYRVEKSRSLQKGGSGLGLAIVKKTVELHGGTVSFECRVDKLDTSKYWNCLLIVFPKNKL